jgi:hypothetical protein
MLFSFRGYGDAVFVDDVAKVANFWERESTLGWLDREVVICKAIEYFGEIFVVFLLVPTEYDDVIDVY